MLLFILLTVADNDVAGGIGFGKPGGEALGAVDGAVLAAGAAEGDLEGGEVAFEVFLDALSDDGLDVVEKLIDGRFFLQEFDNRAVLASVGLVLGEASRVGKGAAVEDESAAVAGGVGGEAFFEAEGEDGDGEGRFLGE